MHFAKFNATEHQRLKKTVPSASTEAGSCMWRPVSCSMSGGSDTAHTWNASGGGGASGAGKSGTKWVWVWVWVWVVVECLLRAYYSTEY